MIDMVMVQDGIGQKVSLFISGTSMFFSALIVGFIRGWKLTLIMLSGTVAMILMMGLNGRNMRANQVKAVDEFATAGTLAEEVISSARNVTAYGTQNRLLAKYKAYLTRASKWDFLSKFWLSSMIACLMAVVNMQYALAFWQGNRFLKQGELGVANILTIIMAAVVAGISLGHNLPHIQAFGGAVAAATKVFNTIERDSPINPETEEGEKPSEFIGNIEFKDIKHIYPSRPDTTVVENFNLTTEPGKMVALVGASGSGKSTIFGLLERFYLPMAGQVFLDGRDISTLNLKWLRRQMALVSQEPILFSITIYESIAHGLVGTEYEHVCIPYFISEMLDGADGHRLPMMLKWGSSSRPLRQRMRTILSWTCPKNSKLKLVNAVIFYRVGKSSVSLLLAQSFLILRSYCWTRYINPVLVVLLS
jgi:ATP-binding cassette subfamily B (MDR/TAP) protein 1